MRISLAWGALALVACRGGDAPTAPAPTATPTAAAPAAEPDGVTVAQVGAEPRRALRYHLGTGARAPIAIAVDLALQAGAMEAMVGPMPTLMLGGVLTVESVLPSGEMAVRVVVDHTEVRPHGDGSGRADAYAAEIKRFEGFVETGVLSPTGHLRDAHVELAGAPPALQAQLASLAQHLEQVAIPLPAQPIGVGARWTTTRPITTNGVAVTMTTTTELTSLAGDRATYTTKTEVAGADQRAQLGGLDVALHHIVGAGGGSGSIDLGTLAVTGSFTTALNFDVAAGGESAQLGMSMTVALNPPSGQGAQSAP